MKKKGAIEFSMTTIIVVIIGVLILALAIPWLQRTFSSVESLTDTAFEQAKTQLTGELSASNNIIVIPSTLKLKANEQATVSVGCFNDAVGAKSATLSKTDPDSSTLQKSDDPSGSFPMGSKNYWGMVVKANSGVSSSTNPDIITLTINCNGVAETRPLTIMYE